MSAWVVSKRHVAAMVKWYVEQGDGEGEVQRIAGGAAEAAAMLYAENVRSVNHRYSDHTPDEPIAFTSADLIHAPAISAVEAIKAAHCLEYQSCETDDYKRTKAYKLCRYIESAAMHRLPGYDAAPWGID